MGTIYAVANQKGGVGKTTTAVNAAACVAEAGYPTLLVDVDPQCNATTGLGLAKDLSPNVYDVIAGESTLAQATHGSAIDGLAVVPASPDLAGATVELPRLAGGQIRLRDALAPARDGYAFTFLDCPPSLGPLTVNALAAADRVLVPVQAEYYALEGVAQILASIEAIRARLNPRLTIAGLLLTMVDGRTRLAADVGSELERHFGPLLFRAQVPRSVRIAEAPSHGLPVIAYDRTSAGADAYWRAAMELVERS